MPRPRERSVAERVDARWIPLPGTQSSSRSIRVVVGSSLTPSTGNATSTVLTRYNATDMDTEVFEDGRWVRSWESTALQSTKKCDMETGEDQKGV